MDARCWLRPVSRGNRSGRPRRLDRRRGRGRVIQWPWSGGTNPQWKLLPHTDGSYRLSNVRSGKVLQSPGVSAHGAGLNQFTADGSHHQSWKLVPSPTSGYHQLVNVRTGWRADVKDAYTTDGAAVIQWPSTGGSDQVWQIVAM